MKINKSNVVKSFCAIFLLGIIAVSCAQDPIFYIVTTETAPIPPLIPGSPTNMVIFEHTYLSDPANPGSKKTIPLLFVASGSLHWYGGNPSNPEWDGDYGIPQPEGRITSLAVTKNRMYALCLDGNSTDATLRYIGRTGGWNTIPGTDEYPLIQSIYADPETNRLFVGAAITSKTEITYAILYLDLNENRLKVLRRKTAMLSGAVYRNSNGAYYLCTRGDGIFKVSESNLATNNINDATVLQLNNIGPVEIEVTIPDPENPPEIQIKIETVIQRKDNKILFMGMIKLEDSAESIIAVERTNATVRASGALYEILEKEGSAYFSQMYYNNDYKNKDNSITTSGHAMGVLALWEDTNGYIKRLVAGRQGSLTSSSYNNGYVEFNLKPDDSFDKTNNNRSMLTVHDPDRYSTNLGKLPINHLLQTPPNIDIKRTFFASTQTAGLWSYRDRPSNGGWQWNAEN
jgi:hypothetical protein